MTIIRSIVFNAVFYLNLIIQMIIFTPYYFLSPRKQAWNVPKNWAKSNLWLQKVIAGTDHHIDGLENIPDGPYICAAKHQSFWDTYAFLPHIADPVYILKRELTWIPLFGWYIKKMKMVPIDRGKRSAAMKTAVRGARQAVAENRQLMIYPEGTRMAPGAAPRYKYGVAHIYGELGIPVVPIAHNAGLYWPRRKFMRYPGVIRCRILPPIEPGLDNDAFLKKLEEVTEAACDDLLIEAAKSENPPPMPPTAINRLSELGVNVSRSTH
jgi:1-acyl-sn-glycerol-3-phosphate acyltransferase